MSSLKIIRYGLAGWIPGGRLRCVICGHAVHRFMPYRNGRASISPLLDTLDVIGSDVENFECPRCGCHDRERHLLLYLRASGILTQLRGAHVLHFAPEKHLSRVILAAAPSSHLCVDLHPSRPGIERMDLMATGLPTASVDLLLANHVLEHVDDDLRALDEIARLLSPGGRAILQTPYSRTLAHTWSDPGIASPAQRLQAYGQEDHVRLYGRDIFERFASRGLTAQIGTHAELLPDHDPRRNGVNPREPFFLYRRG
ncbi:MAG: methyltransferase domain-containing protein [Xanthomonadales bacterium]|nr:hypothetical protein [Xanthomonadales bacterium]MCC6592258.1 methyltransferase domain-containing protein [Xanthomonadales bacterium]MCE7930676.1 SAM-dependent methyltransferase [Xanthomonadales bacterium PRO6]